MEPQFVATSAAALNPLRDLFLFTTQTMRLFEMIDMRGDGKISFQEFSEVMLTLSASLLLMLLLDVAGHGEEEHENYSR